jgi:hypothetical protein
LQTVIASDFADEWTMDVAIDDNPGIQLFVSILQFGMVCRVHGRSPHGARTGVHQRQVFMPQLGWQPAQIKKQIETRRKGGSEGRVLDYNLSSWIGREFRKKTRIEIDFS